MSLSRDDLDRIRGRALCPYVFRAAQTGDEDCMHTIVEHDVPALITEVERLRREVARLHYPVIPVFSWQSGLRFEEPCPECLGRASGDEFMHPCGCWTDEDATLDLECAVCSEVEGGIRRHAVLWPCPTIGLLDPTTK